MPFRKARLRCRRIAACALLFAAIPLSQTGPLAALWTTPCILVASLLIAWGAESAQFFVAQGFALAILAWMQTLPEFAVEAILAWKQQTTLLLANLTGALRLLTGLAWPMIYVTAAVFYRRRTGMWLKSIQLEPHHSVEVVGLMFPLLYALVIWWKSSLHIYDSVILVAIYAAYLLLLTRLPPQRHEEIEELESIPRAVVTARPAVRTTAILALFIAGGVLIYFTAEPFLGSLISVAAALSIPSFVVIQWLAPIVSEFPELASTFYFARQEGNAPIALMNIVSSNINQWTMLVAMLPIVLSLGHGSLIPLVFDQQQRMELLLTIAQSLLAFTFILNMELEWWEAVGLVVLFGAQFAHPNQPKPVITTLFLVWAALEILRMVVRRRKPLAFTRFAQSFATVLAARRSRN